MSENKADEAQSATGAIFNSDLAVSDGDKRALHRDFPLCADLIVWPELAEAFSGFEKTAVNSKTHARKLGLKAIRYALVALLLLCFGDLLRPGISWVLGMIGMDVPTATYLSSLLNHVAWGWFFIAGLWYANQSLTGKRRRAWLQPRACAERLRQFHFQFLISSFDWIVSTDSKDWEVVKESRAPALERALEAINPSRGVSLEALTQDLEHRNWRLTDGPEGKPSGRADRDRTAEFLKYLEKKRVHYQAEHARRMIDPEPEDGTPSVEAQLRHHRSALKRNSLCFVVFQLIALALYLIDATGTLTTGWSGIATLAGESFPFSIFPALAQMIALGFATLVVAERVREDGLHLRSDLARYRTYAGLIRRVENGMKEAEVLWNSGDEESLQKMKRWMMTGEELAYWELRTFCEVHRESSFSL